MVKLLVEADAKIIELNMNGSTALIYAKDLDVVKYLLSKGADLSAAKHRDFGLFGDFFSIVGI